MHKVSIIIAVWNGEKYLASAIDSALAQDYKEIEVIVVDDGSSDATSFLLQSYGNQICTLWQENQGLGASRNRGIEMATGSYFAFLDHDDVWPKEKIRLQMNTCLSQDALIFGHVEQFFCPTLTSIEKEQLRIDVAPQPGYFAGTMLLSRRRWEEIGPFLEKKVLGEFVDWYLRAQEKKIPQIVLSETLLYRRVHQDNMGRQTQHYRRSDYLKILQASLQRRRKSIS